MTDVQTPPHPSAPAAERWVVNRAPTRRLSGIDLGEAWRQRELAVILATRTFKLRYRQTFFGVAWALLQPLIALAIFSVIFGRYAKLPADGVPYAVFVYPALCLWTYFSSSVSGAAVELIDHQELVTKVYFPRVLAPVSALLPGLVDLAISLVLAGILVAVSGQTPSWALVLLPVWLALAVLAALGLGVLLAAINVRFRDVRHTLPFLLQTWFFASPIVYASSLVPDGGLRALYALNPLVLPIDGIRWSLVSADPPPLADLTSLATIAVLVLAAVFYFRASERRFADLI